jgi:hypothetical protein
MSDDWRAHIRWVVHPTEPKVLLARRDGALRLPEVERPGRVWTGDPGAVRVVEELEAGSAGPPGRPWAARGWFAGAERWLEDAMAAVGRPVTGPVEQVRVWELSCVLRAPTAAGDVWPSATSAGWWLRRMLAELDDPDLGTAGP